MAVKLNGSQLGPMTGNAAHDAANVHLFGKPPSPYKCPRHDMYLVRRVIELSPVGRRCLDRPQVEFFQCPFISPVTVTAGVTRGGIRCTFCKPNKWQRKAAT
jgi:hypothetical protein